MNRMLTAVVAALALALAATGALAQGKTHKLAIHVNQNDPAVMNLALNNAKNVADWYKSKGDKVVIELVAYGPGLHMLRSDTSPVKQRISSMVLELPDLSFAACGNTHALMSKNEGKDVPLLSESKKVTSGVVRLMELQEQGYAYLKP